MEDSVADYAAVTENIISDTPGVVFCRDEDSISALVKRWRLAKKYAILFEPNALEPFLLPPTGVFLAFDDECVYFMRLRVKCCDERGTETIELHENGEEAKPSLDLATAIEILRNDDSKKMTIDLKAQLRSLLSAETFEDRESRLKQAASNSFKHYFAFCGEHVFDLRVMAWLLRCDVHATPCVSSVNAWGSSRMLRESRERKKGGDNSKGTNVVLHSSSNSF